MFRLCPLSGFCTLKLRAIAEYEQAENEHYADDDCQTVAVVARNFDVEHAENHTADGGAYERQRDGEYAEPEQAFCPGGGERCAVRKLLLQVRYREAQHNAVKR